MAALPGEHHPLQRELPVLAAVQAAADDGAFEASESITIVIALLVALGVFAVPNKPR